MRCPRCGATRIALAAEPGAQPGGTRVCLTCGHLWEDDSPAGAERHDADRDRSARGGTVDRRIAERRTR